MFWLQATAENCMQRALPAVDCSASESLCSCPCGQGTCLRVASPRHRLLRLPCHLAVLAWLQLLLLLLWSSASCGVAQLSPKRLCLLCRAARISLSCLGI